MSKFWHLKDLTTSIIKRPQPNETRQNLLLLPNQIGCRIIQMQMETVEAGHLNKEIIMDLISEYNVNNNIIQKAIQFYEERGSQKYLLYQKKLQQFIIRPSVSEVLQGKTGTFLLQKEKNQEQLKKLQLHSHAEVKRILQHSQNSGKKQQGIIRKQLQSQQKDLEQRLQRKKAMNSQSKRKKFTTASFSMPSSQKQIPHSATDLHVNLSEFVEVQSPLSSKRIPEKLAF